MSDRKIMVGWTPALGKCKPIEMVPVPPEVERLEQRMNELREKIREMMTRPIHRETKVGS